MVHFLLSYPVYVYIFAYLLYQNLRQKTVDIEFVLGHIAYLSMLMVEVYHSHPVLRTFVELLNQTTASRLEREIAGLVHSDGSSSVVVEGPNFV